MQALPNGGSVIPMPLARGAVHCVKFIVPVIVPVTVALPVAAAVAFARIENPQIYVVVVELAASVAVVAPVVPVADAVIGMAPSGYNDVSVTGKLLSAITEEIAVDPSMATLTLPLAMLVPTIRIADMPAALIWKIPLAVMAVTEAPLVKETAVVTPHVALAAPTWP